MVRIEKNMVNGVTKSSEGVFTKALDSEGSLLQGKNRDVQELSPKLSIVSQNSSRCPKFGILSGDISNISSECREGFIRRTESVALSRGLARSRGLGASTSTQTVGDKSEDEFGEYDEGSSAGVLPLDSSTVFSPVPLSALKGGDKVRLYSEVVFNQFMHRLIMNGKASKARSILRKSLVIFANTPVFADWADSAGVASATPSVKSVTPSVSELNVKHSAGVNTLATASAFGPFPTPSAPSNTHLGFLMSKQGRCRWSKVSVGSFYPQPIVWKALLVVLDKVKPIVEPKTVKRAGRNLCVPSEIPSSRQLSVAIRWVVESARKRSGSSMVGSLAREFEDILSGSMDSGSLKKRDQWHRLAQANRANAGLRAR
jgi:ribosomal protein S7